MGCGCAERMRKYILPRFGYVFDEAAKTWINNDISEEDLRVINDASVAAYHTRLTIQIFLQSGRAKFLEWAKEVNWNISEDKVDAIEDNAETIRGVDK